MNKMHENDVRREENALNAIIQHGIEIVSEPKIVNRCRLNRKLDVVWFQSFFINFFFTYDNWRRSNEE
jgi:hypothetical protein